MWMSLLLPVPFVQALASSPMPIRMPCLPVMPVAARVGKGRVIDDRFYCLTCKGKGRVEVNKKCGVIE
jgi:hypothetical protein